MRLFAIADLHLPGGTEKTMDRFGPGWVGHFEKIRADWRARVGAQDVVLLPGDLSWAMNFADAQPDLRAVCDLPGRKVLLKGNHDYWWNSVSRLRAFLGSDAYALQNDAVFFDGLAVAGSRGWDLDVQADDKVLRREMLRMRMSLQTAQSRSPRQIVAMMHYPPFDDKGRPTAFTDLFEQFGVSDVVYGHLHGYSIHTARIGLCGGVRYHLVSCDALGFSLLELPVEAASQNDAQTP